MFGDQGIFQIAFHRYLRPKMEGDGYDNISMVGNTVCAFHPLYPHHEFIFIMDMTSGNDILVRVLNENMSQYMTISMNSDDTDIEELAGLVEKL